MIRQALGQDVPEILGIYAPYILNTTITFEYEVPTLSEFWMRFERITARYPWIVWEEEGQILGYAYADEAFVRAAFSWDVDLSIYLRSDARGRGIGNRLYGCLEEMLRQAGYHNLYGLVTGENVESMRFHEHRGYKKLGCLEKSGWKMGRWIDICWYGMRLAEAGDPGAKPEPFVFGTEAEELMKRYSE